MQDLRLVKLNSLKSRHASLYDVNEFEQSIIEIENIKIIPEMNNRFLKYFFRPGIVNIINAITPKFSFPVFYISMGISEANRSIPHAFFSSHNVLYIFDAWPKYYPIIRQIVKAYNISHLFVSSKESADVLETLLVNTKVCWCPEACSPTEYKPFAYNKKDIDVLQFGRKYENWHNLVVEGFKQQEISYMYEKIKGQVVFKNRADFLNGLGRTKVSVCFPMNITNVEISGGISTMTYRYIQSMASKCLIVGIKPDEMNYLFNYEPMIQVDYDNPVRQISDILKNYNDYIPLIERNYRECINKHTWKNRWKMIRETIKE
jgi:hypothetical protein